MRRAQAIQPRVLIEEARKLYEALGAWLAEQDAEVAIKKRYEERMAEHRRHLNEG